MAGHDQDQPPPRRIGAAEAARLDALHALAPLRGRRLLVAHAFLLTAASDIELETAAAAHQAQAGQLADRRLVEAMRTAYRLLEPTWRGGGFRALGPGAGLGELLALAPAEQAELIEVELRAAGLDPHATGWPSESAG